MYLRHRSLVSRRSTDIWPGVRLRSELCLMRASPEVRLSAETAIRCLLRIKPAGLAVNVGQAKRFTAEGAENVEMFVFDKERCNKVYKYMHIY